MPTRVACQPTDAALAAAIAECQGPKTAVQAERCATAKREAMSAKKAVKALPKKEKVPLRKMTSLQAQRLYGHQTGKALPDGITGESIRTVAVCGLFIPGDDASPKDFLQIPRSPQTDAILQEAVDHVKGVNERGFPPQFCARKSLSLLEAMKHPPCGLPMTSTVPKHAKR